MNLFRKIHLWLSVPFGLIISVICFTGAVLVFEQEVTQWARPELYKVESAAGQPLLMDVLLENVADGLDEDVQITGVTVFDDPSRTYQVSLSKPHRASVYVDQYSGEIKGRNERLPFFTFMFKMHRWLMGRAVAEDGGIGLGRLIVGVSTLMFVFVLISGAVIWWPRNKQMLTNRLAIKWNKGWRRLWYDLHVAGGIYALVLLLALSLTGLTWSFSWYKKGFYKVFGAELVERPKSENGGKGSAAKGGTGKSHRSAGKKNSAKETSGKGQAREMDFSQWQKVYDQLSVSNQEASKIMISNGSAQVYSGSWGNQRASDTYKFKAATGEMTEFSPYAEADRSKKIGGWIYSVHVGNWGGLFSRVLTFLVSLFGSSLPLTGYYLWFKRLKK